MLLAMVVAAAAAATAATLVFLARGVCGGGGVGRSADNCDKEEMMTVSETLFAKMHSFTPSGYVLCAHNVQL